MLSRILNLVQHDSGVVLAVVVSALAVLGDCHPFDVAQGRRRRTPRNDRRPVTSY